MSPLRTKAGNDAYKKFVASSTTLKQLSEAKQVEIDEANGDATLLIKMNVDTNQSNIEQQLVQLQKITKKCSDISKIQQSEVQAAKQVQSTSHEVLVQIGVEKPHISGPRIRRNVKRSITFISFVTFIT